MGLRAIAGANPPTRVGIWTQLCEAFGYFGGGIKMTEVNATNFGFDESQIQFYPFGHNHPYTTATSGVTAGAPLVTTGINETHFDYNDLKVAWGRFFAGSMAGSHIYGVWGGRGICSLSSVVTLTAASTTGGEASYRVMGSCYIDYNPLSAATSCTLDLRAVTAFDTADTYLYTTWTLVHAYPSMAGGVSGATYNAMNPCIRNFCVGYDTVAPFFAFQALRFGASTDTTNYQGWCSFDYLAVVRKL